MCVCYSFLIYINLYLISLNNINIKTYGNISYLKIENQIGGLVYAVF